MKDRSDRCSSSVLHPSPSYSGPVSARILIAEDDPKQADLIRLYLEREGHSVVVTHDGRSALEQTRQKNPDLLVLDMMMPRMDGLDVCRVLRAESEVPIIMLTARSTEDDMLLGLDLGADDYLAKPFSPRELVARVRTVLRRAGKSTASADSPLRMGELEVDLVRHEVRSGPRLIDCTPTEFSILACLMAQPGRAFTREHLLAEAFGFDHYVYDRTIDVHVMNLRRKIEHNPAEPEYILTVYGVGYKMAERVRAS